MNLKMAATIGLLSATISSTPAWGSLPSTITPYVDNTVKADSDGIFVLAKRRLLVPHMSQPTGNTCGATVLNMLINWEHQRQRGSFYPSTDINAIYEYLNSNNVSGLQTPELKNGLNVIPSIYGLSINYQEVGSSTINGAIDYYLSNSLNRGVPIIIYGNTNTPDGDPGGHYYLGVGAASSAKGFPFVSVSGMYINDSVYGSPAYPPGSQLANQSLGIQSFVSSYTMENYWKPTGSPVPFLRKHMFISIN